MDLVLGLPGPDEPGYLKRQMATAEFFASLATGGSYDSLIEFLLSYVREPEDKDEAREALLSLSKAEYQEVLAAIRSERAEVLPNDEEASESS